MNERNARSSVALVKFKIAFRPNEQQPIARAKAFARVRVQCKPAIFISLYLAIRVNSLLKFYLMRQKNPFATRQDIRIPDGYNYFSFIASCFSFINRKIF